MKLLKQSTATTLVVGPIVDSADASAETGQTIAQADVLLWKEGGTTLAQKNDATSATHRSNGLYTVPVNTTDTNTLGQLIVNVAKAGTLVFRDDYMVVPANVYDSLVLGTDVLTADVTQVGGSTSNVSALATNVAAILADTGTDGVAISSSTLNSIADTVWDEATSAHVTAGSFGQALGGMASGTAQAGAATTITLAAGASATDDFYNNAIIKITGGTGAGQSRIISDYNGTTKVATVPTWGVNPSSDSVYVLLPFGAVPGASAPTASEVADAVWDEARADHTSSGSFGQSLGGIVIRSATAQAGSTTTITLDASASATNDIYNYNQIVIISGTGAGQSRQITDYVGASKVATVGVAFTTAPSSDSVFLILPLGVDAATVAAIADAVWDEARADHTTAGTFGEYTNADAVRISGDATAANNCESFFDGTGYAGTNNVIPLVTTVTTLTGHTAQTGDAFARLGAPAGASVSADIAAVKSETAAIVADTNELQTDLANGGRLDLLVDAIKAKTDSLTFTEAGTVDANVQMVNDVTITGDGSGTPFGV